MTRTKAGMKVRAGIKAGGMIMNHNRGVGLRVRAGVKAAGLITNHNRTAATAR